MSLTNAQVVAEFIGTTIFLAMITGSGIVGENLSQGNAAVALLGGSIATGCGLYVLIAILWSISGVHFNPVVSVMFWRAGALNVQHLFAYIVAQMAGAIAGVWLAHILFELPIMQTSMNH